MDQTTEATTVEALSDLAPNQAQLAFTIIDSLLNHTNVVHDLIALMAQVLDEDTVKALTNTPQWMAYLDSKRVMETTQKQLEEFSAIMISLSPPEVEGE